MRTSSQPFLSVAAAERGEDSSASSGERDESGGTEQSGFRVETVFDALDEHVERFRFRAEVRFGDVAGEGEVVEEKEEFAFGEEEGGGRSRGDVSRTWVGLVNSSHQYQARS